ncbi:hypothetical protein HYV10_01260 [Candidatus Dependentiae bacterium]|nr:hypothetical protein [Candidatus Dependentiae bacterium]
MKKLILLCIFFTLSIFSAEFTVTLPAESVVLSLLTVHIGSWSELTLSDISKEIAKKDFSQISLEKYLLQRMLGDTHVICPELSNAAEAIIARSYPSKSLSN